MPPDNCAGSQGVLVTSSDEGYLASTVTYSTNCGFASTPWVLQAQPGQKYIISLTDFAAVPLHKNLLPSSGGEAAASGRGGSSLDHCRVVYAVIKEPQSALHQLSMTVCSLPGAKDEVVYTSQGHEVEVRIRGSSLSISSDEGEGSAFLLHYTVTGCAEAAAVKRWEAGGGCRRSWAANSRRWRQAATMSTWTFSGDCSVRAPRGLAPWATAPPRLAAVCSITVLTLQWTCLHSCYLSTVYSLQRGCFHTASFNALE
jgi:hypothetical protein